MTHFGCMPLRPAACFCAHGAEREKTCRSRAVGYDSFHMGEVVLPSVVHVVDDDVSFQTAIRRRLQLAGYEVQTYSSAEQFLDQQPNDNNRSGCLLLHVRIPGLSGPELQGRLHEAGSTLPIVFVSAHEDIQTTVQPVKSVPQAFLIKPATCDVLLPAIERAIARHHI